MSSQMINSSSKLERFMLPNQQEEDLSMESSPMIVSTSLESSLQQHQFSYTNLSNQQQCFNQPYNTNSWSEQLRRDSEYQGGGGDFGTGGDEVCFKSLKSFNFLHLAFQQLLEHYHQQ
jgi:hypothetical protein